MFYLKILTYRLLHYEIIIVDNKLSEHVHCFFRIQRYEKLTNVYLERRNINLKRCKKINTI